jgi:hypothetical protein
MRAVEIGGLSNMVALVAAVIKTLLILVTGNLFASISPVLLVSNYDATNTAHSLLTIIDLLVFWALAVKAIGLATVGRRSLGSALAWVFGIWIAYTGLMTGAGLALKAAFGG